MRNKEQIKKLIKNGFDIKLISFELDIPVEELIQYKMEIEQSKESNKANSKITQMREKYKKLYFRSNNIEIERPQSLSEDDIELIKNVITEIEKKVEEIKHYRSSTENKHFLIKQLRYPAYGIIGELKKIEEYDLPLDLGEQLYSLMSSKEVDSLNVNSNIGYSIGNHKRKIACKYAKAIELEHYDIEDIETLSLLQRKITGELIRENPIQIESVKRKVISKISSIQQQNAIKRIKNNIPENIKSIIQDIANGNVDIQNANRIIDEEARRRVESKQKTRFSLTEEQERKQVLIQIRTAIIEKAEQFHIKDPESTILQLHELCGDGLEQSIRAVVKNLLAQKDFETAQAICDNYYNTSRIADKESEFTKYLRGLRNEIRHAKLGDIVMKLINMVGSPEEEEKCFVTLEKGLKMGNVNLRAISLGKSKDGVKEITLADIWEEEKQKSK